MHTYEEGQEKIDLHIHRTAKIIQDNAYLGKRDKTLHQSER